MYTYVLPYNFGHRSLLTATTPKYLDVLDIFYRRENVHLSGKGNLASKSIPSSKTSTTVSSRQKQFQHLTKPIIKIIIIVIIITIIMISVFFPGVTCSDKVLYIIYLVVTLLGRPL